MIKRDVHHQTRRTWKPPGHRYETPRSIVLRDAGVDRVSESCAAKKFACSLRGSDSGEVRAVSGLAKVPFVAVNLYPRRFNVQA